MLPSRALYCNSVASRARTCWRCRRGGGGRKGGNAAANSGQQARGNLTGSYRAVATATTPGSAAAMAGCINHCASCIDYIRRWPAGRAALLAHPLAAEALVAALERLRDAAPSPDTIRAMGMIVYTVDWLYRPAGELEKAAKVFRYGGDPACADSAHAADSAPEWRHPVLLRRLVDVLAPLATGTSEIATYAVSVLGNLLTDAQPTITAAALTSPALHAALPQFILSGCGSSSSSSSSGGTASASISSLCPLDVVHKVLQPIGCELQHLPPVNCRTHGEGGQQAAVHTGV